MRGHYLDLIQLALEKQGEFDSTDTKMLGWDHTFVLLMCLPVFFSFLAYAGILFYEVATKKEFISSKPLTITTTTAKYVDTGANPPQLPGQPTTAQGTTAGTTVNSGEGGALATNVHQPVDPANPLARPPVVQTGGTNQPAAVIEKDTTVELYIWEELLIYMAIHIVGLTFCVQPALRKRDHNAVGVVIAWLHFAYILGYAFVSVDY